MGAVAVILLTAGVTTYTLVNPALGVVFWIAALVVGGWGIVRSATGAGHRRQR